MLVLKAQVKGLQEQEHQGGEGLGGFIIKWRSGVGGLVRIASGVIMPKYSSRRRVNVVRAGKEPLKMRASEFRAWNTASEDAREQTSSLERSWLDSGVGDSDGMVGRYGCGVHRPVTGQRLPLASKRQEQHTCHIKLELLLLDDQSSPVCPRSCSSPSVFKATCKEEKIATPRDMDSVS